MSFRTRRLLARLRPRLTLRARLTMVYGSLFLVSGIVLLATTYALFTQQLNTGAPGFDINSQDADSAPPPATSSANTETSNAWENKERQRLNAAATATLLTQGSVALVVVGAAAGGMGWILAGRVLMPLHRVTDTAARIAAAPTADHSLHERIALVGPNDEVKDLADTFDIMIERLDRSFDSQRRFVANASHELRTPLTINRALVEMAIHRRSASDDVKQVGAQLLENNARHERLISGLLLLAGVEDNLPNTTPVDLAELIRHVVARASAEARQSDITIRAEPVSAVTPGDPLLLESLINNLVENGILHNVPGGWVRVETSSRRDDQVQLRVISSGPDVPSYEVGSLFEPFRRLGSERLVTAKGTGLGLSIVRAIARAHRGAVEARPNPGGGLIVTVRLPALG